MLLLYFLQFIPKYLILSLLLIILSQTLIFLITVRLLSNVIYWWFQTFIIKLNFLLYPLFNGLTSFSLMQYLKLGNLGFYIWYCLQRMVATLFLRIILRLLTTIDMLFIDVIDIFVLLFLLEIDYAYFCNVVHLWLRIHLSDF